MLTTELHLPCGAVIKNRLCKSAMTERLSRSDYKANDLHFQLYERWAKGHAGIMVTGNIMVDKRSMESAGNIALEDTSGLEELTKLARIGTAQGQHFWVQISHPGRQTMKLVNARPVSASDVQLKKMGLFNKPRPMTLDEIQDLIQRYRFTAEQCKIAGFTGIQIHAAHGYLVSQFLSPTTNKRTDQYGGPIENRARLLLEILAACREVVGPEFPIGVKLNSADFQRGGFTEEDSMAVIEMLNDATVDLLEISGGTYEQLVFFTMNHDHKKASTKKREAYFLDYARKVRDLAKMPIMVTGGFRTRSLCIEALESGALDMIGVARPYLLEPDRIADFLSGELEAFPDPSIRTGIKMIDDSAEGGFYAKQLIRIAEGKNPNSNYSPFLAANFLIIHEVKKAFSKKRGASQ
ncbi:MAG: NADH:flavin oxidoreductase/NADH oxidase family protein [Bacteroidota bacterium]